ncbi:MAG: permease-like cell division protein FtsX [Bacteroidales bacterium]|nr:permease-like cell division protein FtsX [Bacteroidales bacterium]
MISISLVLLLVGIASLLLVNARSVSDYFKENMQVSILLKQEVEDDQAAALKAVIDSMRFIKTTETVSREQGIREMSDMLGEDFLSVFSSAPVPISIMATLNAEYMSPDSLEVVSREVSAFPEVDEVVWQQNLVNALNSNLGKISLVIGVFILLLLFISYVLINNTVRLNVFSRRFTIHTMQLVGATRSFIRAPFMVQACFQGLISAFVAIIMLVAILFFLRSEFAQLFEVFELSSLLVVVGIVVVTGLVICLFSTYFVVNRLVRLSKDELYA